MNKNFKDIVQKAIKNAAYEAGKGTMVIGGAAIYLVDADLSTVLYLVIAGFVFNLIKEFTKPSGA